MQTKIETRELRIFQIRAYPEINVRELDLQKVAEYADDMREYGEEDWQKHWNEMPVITEDDHLWSGFHTIAAAIEAFGDDRVIECRVEGKNRKDAFFLATGTNVSHGLRRTNADKRKAVLRWLEDEEGKQWTNSYIAKKCFVGLQTVTNIEKSLSNLDSDNYERPTRRKYINKWGQEEWMETAETGKRTDLEPKPTGQKTFIDIDKVNESEFDFEEEPEEYLPDDFEEKLEETDTDSVIEDESEEEIEEEIEPEPTTTPEKTLDLIVSKNKQSLYVGNNIELLPKIETGSIELVCIDPPYNTGKKREKHIGVYEDQFENSESYINWLNPIINECYRVLTDNGSLFLFIDQHEEYNVWTLLREIFGNNNLINKIIWAYDWGHREINRWTSKHDTIFWFAKDKNNYIFNRDESDRIPKNAPNLFEEGSTDKLPTAVWWQTIVTASSGESTGYPTQKPLKIIERIIRVHSNKNDTILDCFAGSGTVGDACQKLGRNSVLIEQNPEAVEIIKSRINNLSICEE